MRINASELQKWHPNAILRSVSSFPYNCVGMVFAARHAWIEIDYLPQILRHDGYSKIDLDSAMIGDVVVYINEKREFVHVGLIVILESLGATANIKVMSKWGLDPEFIHFIDDVPSSYKGSIEFYTDRI